MSGLALRSDPQPDTMACAAAVGLTYVTDTTPGIRRLRSRKGFRYVSLEGKPVRDPVALERIQKLAIPPAYTQIWICPDPQGHLQATGRDSRGRKQYRYHPQWRQVRDECKYERLWAFGQALPRLRERIRQDLAQPGLSRPKVLATVVRLLETTQIRVGNESYARTNDSFGLTTLRDEHVQVLGTTLQFSFRGKSGKYHTIQVNDRRLARIVKSCQDLAGAELFQYLDDQGQPQVVRSTDVNTYLRKTMDGEFSAKDFRTWAGTVFAAQTLALLPAPTSATQTKKAIAQAVRATAQRLGNTPAVCRQSYIHPLVFETYEAGTLTNYYTDTPSPHHPPEEVAILNLLEKFMDTRLEA